MFLTACFDLSGASNFLSRRDIARRVPRLPIRQNLISTRVLRLKMGLPRNASRFLSQSSSPTKAARAVRLAEASHLASRFPWERRRNRGRLICGSLARNYHTAREKAPVKLAPEPRTSSTAEARTGRPEEQGGGRSLARRGESERKTRWKLK